ncbi:hypothetical protein OVY29_08980 [Sphingopyxis sp. SE2]|uniref:hypothetical protein n=1 Tax=unclassified Sphingopyxis TaxID=2614943 RepID=UPI00050EBC3A|nr:MULTISPECIES: hypothetical protein [unclassified Sphingopyxis]KGB55228.1 hypothetical protein FG95_02696 [Sphingopyxis sp. LC363]MDT7528790.1 hypothetical protein [Sphingopyxis sp. SE2]
MTQALFEYTRPFNWQPTEHYGPEGSSDWSEWDEQDLATAQEFLDLTGERIIWLHPSKSGLPLEGVKGEPDYAAQSGEHIFLIGEHFWPGFPDPPQFAIVKCHPVERTTQHLGHFDYWPETWTRKDQ